MRNRIVPRGDELVALFRAEPMLTCKDLAARFAVSGEAARVACKASGIVPSKLGRPAKVPEAELVAAPIEQAPLDPIIAVQDMFDANPHLTATQIMAELGVSLATAYRLVKKAGIELRNPLRKLPDDTALAAEIKKTSNIAVAEKYGIDPNRVSRHAVRLGVVRKGKQLRKLPPENILAQELEVLSVAEIAQRYGCSEQVVRDQKKRIMGVKRRLRRGSSVAALPMISTAIAHLHAYRGILAAIDPGKANALLDDIEELATVASALTTIASIVAAPRSL